MTEGDILQGQDAGHSVVTGVGGHSHIADINTIRTTPSEGEIG